MPSLKRKGVKAENDLKMKYLRNIRFKIAVAAGVLCGWGSVAAQTTGDSIPAQEQVVALADSVSPQIEMPDSAASSVMTAADYFVNAPMSIFPTIDRMTRLDMIDYYNAGSDKASRNLVNGSCKVLEETPEKIVVQTSPVSEYTIALLPSSDKKIGKLIMLVTTLKTPAEDSSVKFYNTSWEEVKGIFRVPLLDDWMLPEARKNRQDVENALPFVIAKLEYFPEQQKAVLTHDLPSFVAEEMLGIAKSSLKNQLTFHWNGKRLVIDK